MEHYKIMIDKASFRLNFVHGLTDGYLCSNSQKPITDILSSIGDTLHANLVLWNGKLYTLTAILFLETQKASVSMTIVETYRHSLSFIFVQNPYINTEPALGGLILCPRQASRRSQ